jgi:hypothetical protein
MADCRRAPIDRSASASEGPLSGQQLTVATDRFEVRKSTDHLGIQTLGCGSTWSLSANA